MPSEPKPICQVCGDNNSMVCHDDGTWHCHRTHVVDTPKPTTVDVEASIELVHHAGLTCFPREKEAFAAIIARHMATEREAAAKRIAALQNKVLQLRATIQEMHECCMNEIPEYEALESVQCALGLNGNGDRREGAF